VGGRKSGIRRCTVRPWATDLTCRNFHVMVCGKWRYTVISTWSPS
jgi:hypothetical protein